MRRKAMAVLVWVPLLGSLVASACGGRLVAQARRPSGCTPETVGRLLLLHERDYQVASKTVFGEGTTEGSKTEVYWAGVRPRIVRFEDLGETRRYDTRIVVEDTSFFVVWFEESVYERPISPRRETQIARVNRSVFVVCDGSASAGDSTLVNRLVRRFRAAVSDSALSLRR